MTDLSEVTTLSGNEKNTSYKQSMLWLKGTSTLASLASLTLALFFNRASSIYHLLRQP